MNIANCPDGGHCQNDHVIEALLAALEAVEWAESPFLDASEVFCPWCRCVTGGHKPDCIRQAAIAAAKPEE